MGVRKSVKVGEAAVTAVLVPLLGVCSACSLVLLICFRAACTDHCGVHCCGQLTAAAVSATVAITKALPSHAAGVPWPSWRKSQVQTSPHAFPARSAPQHASGHLQQNWCCPSGPPQTVLFCDPLQIYVLLGTAKSQYLTHMGAVARNSRFLGLQVTMLSRSRYCELHLDCTARSRGVARSG